MVPEFADMVANLFGKAKTPGGTSKDRKIGFELCQERAQDHGPALFGKELRHGRAKRVENKAGEALERENVQARITVQVTRVQELPFQLVGGLFWREKNQRRAFRGSKQLASNVGETSKRFACARSA